jgi:hypothetical protein
VATRQSHSGLILLIGLGVVVIGGLVVFAVYLNGSLSQTQNQPAANVAPIVNNANANVNQPAVNTNINTNLNIDSVVTATTSVSTSTENTNVSANVNADIDNSPSDSQMTVPLPASLDSDGDGLTDAEEQLYGTNAKVADTDSDGYTDAGELLNNYSPLKPGQTLAQSGLFLTYSQPLYSIIYPKKWTVKEQAADKSEVLFTAGTGEFVEVLVIPNQSGISLINWYKAQFPQNDAAKLTAVIINNLSGFRSQDGQTYYLNKTNDSSKVLVAIYNSGNFSTLNFMTTFMVMIKSFKAL